MAEQQKSGVKKFVWKYFGAMMMEQKGGEWAMSFTRFLALLIFVALMVQWNIGSEVPESMIHTFWALVGIKGAKSVAEAWQKKI